MSEPAAPALARFDASLREALTTLLQDWLSADAADPHLAQTVLRHAQLLRWEAPLRLIEAHLTALQVAGGDLSALEALTQQVHWTWQHAESPAHAPLGHLLKAAIRHRHCTRAIEAVAAALPREPARGAAPGHARVAFVVSNLNSGTGTTWVIRALAQDLRPLGWAVGVYQTGHHDKPNEETLGELTQAGVDVHAPPTGMATAARADWLRRLLQQQPADCVVHYVWPDDFVSQIVSNIRCAPVQIYVNHTCDQATGDFDIKIGYASHYEGHHQPEKYITLPNCSVRGAQARRAQPFEREALGLRPDWLYLATFGRLAKCVDAVYLEAMAGVLQRNPKTMLLLAGEADAAAQDAIQRHMAQAGVEARVQFIGFFLNDDYFRWLKTIDIYCDTTLWTGGQTTADAIVCGRPVACAKPTSQSALAPFANNPSVLACELLPAGTPIARADDAEDYMRVVQTYIDDPTLREQAGEANRRSASHDAWPDYVRRFDHLLRQSAHIKKQQVALA